jgi:non-homologous end joining protein Ku
LVPGGNHCLLLALSQHLLRCRRRLAVRKLIAFDDDTFDKLKQLGRDRMATIQELADEAFADMLKKHGIPIDLKDALRKSASLSKVPAKKAAASTPSRSTSSRKPKP